MHHRTPLNSSSASRGDSTVSRALNVQTVPPRTSGTLLVDRGGLDVFLDAACELLLDVSVVVLDEQPARNLIRRGCAVEALVRLVIDVSPGEQLDERLGFADVVPALTFDAVRLLDVRVHPLATAEELGEAGGELVGDQTVGDMVRAQRLLRPDRAALGLLPCRLVELDIGDEDRVRRTLLAVAARDHEAGHRALDLDVAERTTGRPVPVAQPVAGRAAHGEAAFDHDAVAECAAHPALLFEPAVVPNEGSGRADVGILSQHLDPGPSLGVRHIEGRPLVERRVSVVVRNDLQPAPFVVSDDSFWALCEHSERIVNSKGAPAGLSTASLPDPVGGSLRDHDRGRV